MTYADEFLASTRAQEPRFMTPAPADYLACDRTLNEERLRLRWEFSRLTYTEKSDLLRETYDIEPFAVCGPTDPTDEWLVNRLVDAACPRAWLDRRLREVL